SPPFGQLISLSLCILRSATHAAWRHRGLKWQHGPTTSMSMLHTSAITSTSGCQNCLRTLKLGDLGARIAVLQE
ncbi:hypothetical protein DL95DRAFT_321013, partial [Leptodontidium sp. 2 PMI_412]